MRFNNTLSIFFTTNISSEDLKTPPMLLLPFLENSFKQGVIKHGQLNIKIDLKCNDKTIWFYIENTNSKTKASHLGIGLENVKKRLDLLYDNKYVLKIEDENDIFKVNLKLNLT